MTPTKLGPKSTATSLPLNDVPTGRAVSRGGTAEPVGRVPLATDQHDSLAKPNAQAQLKLGGLSQPEAARSHVETAHRSTFAADPLWTTTERPAFAAELYPFRGLLLEQLSRADLSDEKKADIRKDVANLEKAAAGEAQLPEQTEHVVAKALDGLTPEESAVVRAKAYELASEGYGVEQTGPERFAANLALEISEYFATGTYSEPLLARATELQAQGQSVFAAKPQMELALATNMMLSVKNFQLREAGKPIEF